MPRALRAASDGSASGATSPGDPAGRVASPAGSAPEATAPAGPPDEDWTRFDRVLTPRPTPLRTQLRRVWAYRELLRLLVWRDVKVRYRHTVLGPLWVLAQPATLTAVFSTLLGRLGGLAHRLGADVPYPLFVFSGTILWTLLSTGLNRSANALTGNGYLISRIWFPRLVLPVASVAVGLVDFGVALCGLGVLYAAYGVVPGPQILLLPVVLTGLLGAGLGFGLLLGSLMVTLRDLRQALPFLSWLLLFVSPVTYPGHLVRADLRPLYYLNPLAGGLDAARWALFGSPLWAPGLALSAGTAASVLLLGLWLYGRVERNAADWL